MNVRHLIPAVLTLTIALARDPDTKPAGGATPAPGERGAAQVLPGQPAAEPVADLTLLSAKYTNSLVLAPGRDNKTVAQLVASLSAGCCQGVR